MKKVVIKKIKEAKGVSGVYLFRNSEKEIIYVGRATSLKSRLANYLNSNDLKTIGMTNEAADLETRTTKNLLEAIILESNLIKKYLPKYNIKEKDNRSFVYIVIPKKDWTYPLLVRERELKKYPPDLPKTGFIFGPLTSYSLAKNLLLNLRKNFPWSTCSLNRERPCFHFQIGLCPGKCTGKINKTDYQKNIADLIKFLQGKKKIKDLKINEAILVNNENENEKNFWRRIEAFDISHFFGQETVGAMTVLEDGFLANDQYRIFKIKTARKHDDLSAISELISRRFNHREWPFPDLIVIDGGKGQVNLVTKTLKSLNIEIPVVGISKYAGDKLIFGQTKKSIQLIIEMSKNKLLLLRNEAHRFANKLRKKIKKY